jgi:hypothetical protein
MNWLATQMAVLDTATGAVEFAVNWLLQSTLLIAIGLIIGRLLRQRGSAVQSVVYRTTLAAALICPLATWGLSQAGVSGWSVQVPKGWSYRPIDVVVADLAPSTAVAASEFAAPTRHPRLPTQLSPLIDQGVLADSAASNAPQLMLSDATQSTEPPSVVADLSAEEPVETPPVEFSIHRFALVALGAAAIWLVVSFGLTARLAAACGNWLDCVGGPCAPMRTPPAHVANSRLR